MQNVSSLSVSDLQNLLEQYPWFTLARKEYVRRCGETGRDALMGAAADAGLFVLSRKAFLNELLNPKPTEPAVQKEDVVKEEAKPKIYIIGGDYFGKEEFQKLESSGEAFDINALKHDPIEATASTFNTIQAAPQSSSEDQEMDTETLANIYAQQGLCDNAIIIYKKLILLYPEKSAYFASLIENAKTIAQTIKQQ